MNTSTPLLQRALSLSFAAAVTVMTLMAVDSLATQAPSPALMAQVLAPAPV
jgi:hypothetical protein